MKKVFITGLLLCAAGYAFSQACNCGAAFDWMVSTFSANDAGFRYVVDKKGEADYAGHTEKRRQKAAAISDAGSCVEVMRDWLHYFRSGHIGVDQKEPEQTNSDQPDDNAIRARYKNERTVDLTEKQLMTLLDRKKDRQPVEGIWAYNNYTVGIVKDEKDAKKFNAFIIRSDGVYWLPKQLKAELTLNSDNTFSSSYAMRDHSRQNSTAFLSGNSLLYMGGYWQRLYPKTVMTAREELLKDASASRLPFVRPLNEKTVYLRIPSFSLLEKRNIDSVIATNDALIKRSVNLIIDIRNGTGGGDAAYEKILPYLYTNPIRSINAQLYATELNAQGFERYSTMYSDTAGANYCHRIAAAMRRHLGSFVQEAGAQKVSVDSSMKPLPYPQKVAIIMNQNNGSTDEQFLIDARQSTKVKTFGRPTGGMLDVSNVNIVSSPDDKFSLAYCMSRSYRIPDYCIDGVGIQPDYFMDDEIPKEDWIEYVQKILEH